MLDQKYRHIPFKAKLISNTIAQVINKKTSEIGLTVSQAFVLHFIQQRSSQSICQKDIECYFNIKHPTVTGIIKRLEEKELIECVSSPDDKRLKIIRETDKARALDDEIIMQIAEAEAHMLAPLTEEEQKILSDLLDKIVSNLAPESLNPEFPLKEV